MSHLVTGAKPRAHTALAALGVFVAGSLGALFLWEGAWVGLLATAEDLRLYPWRSEHAGWAYTSPQRYVAVVVAEGAWCLALAFALTWSWRRGKPRALAAALAALCGTVAWMVTRGSE